VRVTEALAESEFDMAKVASLHELAARAISAVGLARHAQAKLPEKY
jgi:hypothetical protein